MPNSLSEDSLRMLVRGRLGQNPGAPRHVVDFTPSGLAEFVSEAVQDAVDPPLKASDLSPLKDQIEKLASAIERNGHEGVKAQARSEHLVEVVLASERRMNDQLKSLRADYVARQSHLETKIEALGVDIATVRGIADGTDGKVTRYRNAVGSVLLAALAGLAWVVQHYFDLIIEAVVRGIPPKG